MLKGMLVLVISTNSGRIVKKLVVLRRSGRDNFFHRASQLGVPLEIKYL